ncbi:DNA-binding ferritin-like protein (oxidative damage protectant) [Leptolyngbyaceae cyanobacterium JSC-12]|nr:DNA-binding ferritin-like protein (oxidative damage protectant) [Leptolyngbyaceae cyanobacterium JSC-12]
MSMMYPTRIDLPADVRAQIIDLLNESLAYTLDLKTQVKQAHWNVKGMDFYQLHELFDELAGELEEYIDLLAERVTTLAGTAMGTARIAAEVSQLPEYPYDITDGKDHIVALADRYAIYAKLLRDGIEKTDDLGDADTADLYTEISRSIDMRLWFLEAHLQTEGVVNSSNGATKSSKSAKSSSSRTAAKTSTTKTTAKATAKKAKTKAK